MRTVYCPSGCLHVSRYDNGPKKMDGGREGP